MTGLSDSEGNKYESMFIRKKFRKTQHYRCCLAPSGNPGKYSSRYCCTYPQVYKRRDITVQNNRICRYLDDDIYLI